jgi:DUF971 family protein
MNPKKVSVKDSRFLRIEWEDDGESIISLSSLRKNCPCAVCISERENKPESYIPLLSTVQLALKDIKVVGNYALQLVWHDGHDSGIYTYDRLHQWKSEKNKNVK